MAGTEAKVAKYNRKMSIKFMANGSSLASRLPETKDNQSVTGRTAAPCLLGCPYAVWAKFATLS